MLSRCVSCLAGVVLIIGCSGDSSSTALSAPVMPAIVSGDLAVLLPLADGAAIDVSGVAYDPFGRVQSFAVTYRAAAGDSLRGVLAVDSTRRASLALAGRDTIWATGTDSTASPIALVPTEAGGVRLRDADSVTTELAYDAFGRQQVSLQTFRLGGARWQVTFSDYARDGFGRLSAVRAVVAARP